VDTGRLLILCSAWNEQLQLSEFTGLNFRALQIPMRKSVGAINRFPIACLEFCDDSKKRDVNPLAFPIRAGEWRGSFD
jgi:hypothetical protein